MHDVYNYLESYGLATRSNLLTRLFHLSDEELSAFFATYRRWSALHPGVVCAPVGAIDIYPDSWMSGVPKVLIMQLAVYASKIYIHDPLLAMVDEWDRIDMDPLLMAKYPDRVTRTHYFRTLTASTIERILDLRPLVEIDVVHILPSRLTQSMNDPLNLYEEDFLGPFGSAADLNGRPLPTPSKPIQAYCDQHLRVGPLVAHDEGLQLMPPEVLNRQRMLGLYFDGDPYFVFRGLAHIVRHEEIDGEYRIWQRLDMTGQELADPATFEHWIATCRKQVVYEKLQQLQHDMVIAAEAHAKFLTTLPASRDLAQLTVGSRLSGDEALATHLRLKLPYFEHATIDSLARARRDVAAFEEFRVQYHQGLVEIAKEHDPQQRQRRSEEVSRELLLAPVARINQEMQDLKQKRAINGLIGFGSLVTNLFTQPLPAALGGLASGAVSALKDYKQERQEEKVSRFPGFFYWKATTHRD